MLKGILQNELFYCNHLGANQDDERDIQAFSARDERGEGLVIYLKDYAFREEINGQMRTYIVRDTATSEIVAYFALKAGLISINALVTEDETTFDTLPCVELANFAVNNAYIENHPSMKGVCPSSRWPQRRSVSRSYTSSLFLRQDLFTGTKSTGSSAFPMSGKMRSINGPGFTEVFIFVLLPRCTFAKEYRPLLDTFAKGSCVASQNTIVESFCNDSANRLRIVANWDDSARIRLNSCSLSYKNNTFIDNLSYKNSKLLLLLSYKKCKLKPKRGAENETVPYGRASEMEEQQRSKAPSFAGRTTSRQDLVDEGVRETAF